MIFQVTSPTGLEIIYDEEAKRHIESRHPEMLGQTETIKRVLTDPLYIFQDKDFENRHCYYEKDVHPNMPGLWVKVVVDHGQRPAVVVTAYPQKKDPKREGVLIYVRPERRTPGGI